jgi:hypothetical protein
MEHIIELVVVDDQVRKYIYVTSAHVQLVRDTPQAFSLVDRAAFHHLLMYQRPNTQDTDIPHCTSIAKAIHEKAYKVTNILKELFAVSLPNLSLTLSLHTYSRAYLGRYLRHWMAGPH